MASEFYLFADRVVLMALSGGGLQLTVEWFAAKCEKVGMRIRKLLWGHGPQPEKSEVPTLGQGQVAAPSEGV